MIQEHNVEQEIITAEDEFKIIEHADIAMDDNLGTKPIILATIISYAMTLTNICSQCASRWWRRWWRPRRSRSPPLMVRSSG